MSDEVSQLGDYSRQGLAAAEAALFAAWEALEKFHEDLVVVGGLAVHYHTRNAPNPRFPATATLDVDFGIKLGTDSGMAGTVQFDLSLLGYRPTEQGRMFREMEHGTLYIDFLTEHPLRQSGTREVSGIAASVCPGINRALAVRKKVEIQGIDQFGDPKTYRVPICGIGPLLVLKLNAYAQRSSAKKAKDAYDLLVAVSSYAEGPRAAIDAFHGEAASGNPAFDLAVKTLKGHFMRTDQEGPLQALRFRYGSNDAGDDGVRLKEDLVTIGQALVDFE
jgi:hypothetical protein